MDEQIQIIREEVDRADQIITELMGYAQLAEGKVERLEVAEELDSAMQEVFPPAAKYQVKIHKNYDAGPAGVADAEAASFRRAGQPAAKRPRSHERPRRRSRSPPATARTIPSASSSRTTARASPPDKIDKIFEAYFTTREKGTGLGLAIVKHNTEMYGGAVQRANLSLEKARGLR